MIVVRFFVPIIALSYTDKLALVIIFPPQYNCFDTTHPPDKDTDAIFIPDTSVASLTLNPFLISKFPKMKTFFLTLAPPSTIKVPVK